MSKIRTESGYGFFCGGDPRRFYPDAESCSEKELANHAAACKLWTEAEARGEKPTPEACPSGWVYDAEGKPFMHVLRAPYGIGGYDYDVEDDRPDPLQQEDIYAALGKAMQKIEAAGASPELTAAVVIVGDVRQSIGNQWNPADRYAAQRVRDALKS